jgi:hypothetical protein
LNFQLLMQHAVRMKHHKMCIMRTIVCETALAKRIIDRLA